MSKILKITLLFVLITILSINFCNAIDLNVTEGSVATNASNENTSSNSNSSNSSFLDSTTSANRY